MQCLWCSSPPTLPSVPTKPANTFLQTLRTSNSISYSKPVSRLFNSISLTVSQQKKMGKPWERSRSGVVCYSTSSLLSPRNLHWVSAVSTGILMLVRGTAINKSFLVPLFALQAPASIISWMQGEYGAWSAFLVLLLRLFFPLPGELELPFMTLLLVIAAPHQAIGLRGTQGGAVVSLAIAAYLAFQHFTRAGSLQKAFEQSSVVATLAIICIAVVPCLLLI